VASSARSPFRRTTFLYAVDPAGGALQALPYGPANTVDASPQGKLVLGRHIDDAARWKRYRGGTVGEIWVEEEEGRFHRLVPAPGNLGRPMWIGERLYFLSDHEGVGNLYSCRPDGSDLIRHTRFSPYYARLATSDGRRVVLQCAGDLYVYDPQEDETKRIPISWRGSAPGRRPRVVDAAPYLTQYAPSPDGAYLALTTRGRVFLMGNWEGPCRPLGQEAGVRYGHAAWLDQGKQVAVVSDEGGREGVEVYDATTLRRTLRVDHPAFGHITEMVLSPRGSVAAVATVRHALLAVDLERGEVRQLDESPYGEIRHLAWSPDGRFLAYAYPVSRRTQAIRLLCLDDGRVQTVTRPLVADFSPSFDPEGRYLFFLSARTFDPVPDNLAFDLGFPQGVRPYLLTLRKDLPNPLWPAPRPLTPAGSKAAEGQDAGEPSPVQVDWDGIEDRVVALPVPEGRYQHLVAGRGKVWYMAHPVHGILGDDLFSSQPQARGSLHAFDLTEHKDEVVVEGVTDYALSGDLGTLAYRRGERLRVVKAGEKVEDKGEEAPGRASGYVDLSRVRLVVDPPREWEQMLAEAHRLMREHFWTEDMSGVDWDAMHARYAQLLGRIATRSDLSDLMWEMQGELGTSHAYEVGGDYGPQPEDRYGTLAAEFRWDPQEEGYRVVHVVQGDTWQEDADSPLRAPGVGVSPGDVLLRINGVRLTAHRTPEEVLETLGGQEVSLSLKGPAGERTVTVRTLRHERAARYREWVERNRRYVHEASGGRVGYVHIPDMGAMGYAEFHRGYLQEVLRDALVVDVRHNGGGYVSQLLLEKLLRRPVGMDFPRRGEPEPYPVDAPLGPLVAVTDEEAGSDGDIFSHAFKLYRLGPLVGRRTWGGVIGISGRHRLVDGTVVTQPEFAFWFTDVGWGVENYGTDPDIPVDNPPEDLGRRKDRQLERAVAEALRLLEEHPPFRPEPGPRPRRTPPLFPNA
jgi:tricorn protease